MRFKYKHSGVRRPQIGGLIVPRARASFYGVREEERYFSVLLSNKNPATYTLHRGRDINNEEVVKSLTQDSPAISPVVPKRHILIFQVKV